MRNLPLSLAALAALAASAAAQEVVLPQGFDLTYTGNTTLLWRSTAFRCQLLYDTRHFLNQGIDHPIVINRLRFRPINGAIDPGGSTWNGVTITLSSSPIDYDVMSTTFSANVGADVVTVFSGNVTTLPANGGAPNDYYIDLTLQTPFVYNPENGNDLLIDITAPNFPTGTVPNTAASSNRTLHFARRNSSATPTATAGGLSDFAAVVKIDYTVPTGVAKRIAYGTGCNNNRVSFYESFAAGAFDLGTTSGVNSILLIPNGNGGYTAVPGSNQWFTPVSANLGLADDALSASNPLPFTFQYPGGSTNAVVVESNGNVWLQPPTHTSFICDTTPRALLTRGPVISVCYDDMDPSATGGGAVYFDADAPNGVCYVTWDQVPIYSAAPSSPRPTNTFQVALYNSGAVELRYQGMNTIDSWTRALTGFSPGANNLDPGNRDISASVPFQTATDLQGLVLSGSTRPVLGRTVNLVTDNVPANVTLSALILSFTRHDPGLPLAGIGMPGCFQYVGLDVTHAISFASPSFSIPIPVPVSTSWIGGRIRAQSASVVPGVNALGILASNGVELQIDAL